MSYEKKQNSGPHASTSQPEERGVVFGGKSPFESAYVMHSVRTDATLGRGGHIRSGGEKKTKKRWLCLDVRIFSSRVYLFRFWCVIQISMLLLNKMTIFVLLLTAEVNFVLAQTLWIGLRFSDNLDGSQNIKPTWPPPHTTPPQKDGDRMTSHASALFEITLWLSHIPRSNHSGVFRSTHVGFCSVSWWSRQRHQWGHAWRGRPEFNNRLGPIGCLGNTTLLISFWAQAKVLSLKG